jgi:hypothetical protein
LSRSWLFKKTNAVVLLIENRISRRNSASSSVVGIRNCLDYGLYSRILLSLSIFIEGHYDVTQVTCLNMKRAVLGCLIDASRMTPTNDLIPIAKNNVNSSCVG